MNRTFLLATALYMIFVIYGSLVPLELKDLPMDTAISQFKGIRYLQLGPDSRADWIANIVLYIPLAFFASATFGGVRYPLLRALLAVVVLIFCIALAVAVEFTQLFYPPRTVSLNDLIAESLGTVIGILGWQFFGAYFSRLYHQLLRGSFLSAQAAIFFYLLIYIALSLFPYDLVTSVAELKTKIANGNDAVVMSFGVCGEAPVRCGIKLISEVVVLMPLGLLFCYVPNLQHRKTMAVLVGLFLGLVIEGVQVFLLSGAGQGISVVMRMVGMGAGVSLFSWSEQFDTESKKRILRRFAGFTVLPYIILVLAINGWFSAAWETSEQALEKLAETRFLPLYYYYYTSEAVALVSLLSNIGMYFPVGFLWWASVFSGASQKQSQLAPHWIYVGLLAALFALVVETGKLFLVNKHADPSDVWLAFIAAATCYVLMSRFVKWLRRDKTEEKPIVVEHVVNVPNRANEKPLETKLPAYKIDKRWRIVSVFLAMIITGALFDYPLSPVLLGILLITYTALLAYFPYAWLLAVPALLPIMDFTPWTGRFFFDEFDLLVLTTLAYFYWQKPYESIRSLLSITSLFLLIVFTISYGISLLIGLMPLSELNANAFSNYYSHYNSLRVGKGYIWALLLLPLLQLTVRRYRYALYYFASGILLGLAGVAMFAVIERIVFVSLFDFASDYRINALFSTMHAGGGHIESYLMLSLPFITLLFVNSAHARVKSLLGVVLFIIGLYALLVTFSRGGYFGFISEFMVLVIALLVAYRKQWLASKKPLLILLLLVISVVMVLPVLNGNMIQQRFKMLEQDHESRSYHWHDALAMRDNDITTALFGMGLGSYPRTFFWLNTENSHPASYEIATENGNNYLRLRGGDSLFVGQYLSIKPHATYRLVMDARSEMEQATVSTSLCEKSLQYSLRCSSVATPLHKQGWEHVEQIINSNTVGEYVAGGLLQRPIQLTFYNGNGLGKLVDVDNVQLLDEAGADVLVNGDFKKGSDFWFFATEKHNPWHIFNFWIHLLFDLGWLGSITFSLLFAKALYTLCRRLLRVDIFACVLLSSFSGFMVVGFVDSPFDAPRLTLLFFLLLFFALMRRPRAWTTN